MLRLYSSWLERSPLLTKAITAGLVSAGGDLGTQTLVEKHSLGDLDWSRLRRFGGLGLFVSAPLLHYWYGFLSRAFPTSPMRRVLADQFGFAPVFLSGFIFGNEFFQRMSVEKSLAKVKQEIQQTVLVNWVVWIPFQSLNFNFVPLQYQVLANNMAAVFWNGYLSWKLHQQHDNKTVKVG